MEVPQNILKIELHSMVQLYHSWVDTQKKQSQLTIETQSLHYHNSQAMESARCPNVVYIHTGVLFSHKEQNYVIC
jgi:hypothetical protein